MITFCFIIIFGLGASLDASKVQVSTHYLYSIHLANPILDLKFPIEDSENGTVLTKNSTELAEEICFADHECTSCCTDDQCTVDPCCEDEKCCCCGSEEELSGLVGGSGGAYLAYGGSEGAYGGGGFLAGGSSSANRGSSSSNGGTTSPPGGGPINPIVPEPSVWLMLGSFLTLVAIIRYRNLKRLHR